MKTHIHDLFGYKVETTKGQEPTGDWLSIGYVTGGELTINENLRRVEAIGGEIFYYSTLEPEVSVEGYLIPDRVSLILNDLIHDDISLSIVAGSTDFPVKFLGCLPNEITLEGRVGEPLRFTVSFVAMKASLLASAPTISVPTANPLLWHDGSVSVSGGNYQISRFTLRVSRAPRLEADFSPKNEGEKRVRNLYAWGIGEVECTLEMFLPYTPDLAADNPAPVDVTIALGSNTLTLNDFFVVSRRTPISGGEDLWVLTVTLRGKKSNISLT